MNTSTNSFANLDTYIEHAQLTGLKLVARHLNEIVFEFNGNRILMSYYALRYMYENRPKDKKYYLIVIRWTERTVDEIWVRYATCKRSFEIMAHNHKDASNIALDKLPLKVKRGNHIIESIHMKEKAEDTYKLVDM